MPKKRFTSQYSKPPSSVHPSLNSTGGASSSSSNQNDAAPTVNDLIISSRKSNISNSTPAPATITTPTLPPQIRHLLSQTETPSPPPRTRNRRRFDANGRQVPAGPAPPRSWLTSSRHAPTELRRTDMSRERLWPRDLYHLPGIPVKDGENTGRRLQDMCLRTMAREWEFMREYERNNLADLPTGLRMLLLSNIAIYGPDDGVGFDGLKNLLTFPANEGQEVGENNNERFYRLDLSGSVGRSITFKHLIELVQKPSTLSEDETTELSWEDTLTRSLSPPIPHLTHLSLSHPPSTISWPRLLTFAKYVPTLTHLSLAYWPVPSLTPNATTAVMSSKYWKDFQYGGTGFYSHSLDDDFREAADIMRRLAMRLYGLEYLDLTGCEDWWRALWWRGQTLDDCLDWGAQWLRMKRLKVRSDIVLQEESEFWEVARFTDCICVLVSLQRRLSRDFERVGQRGLRWVELEKDDVGLYRELWRGGGSEEKKKKRRQIKFLEEGRFEDTVARPILPLWEPPGAVETTGHLVPWDDE